VIVIVANTELDGMTCFIVAYASAEFSTTENLDTKDFTLLQNTLVKSLIACCFMLIPCID
jgi:hypothetical protein